MLSNFEQRDLSSSDTAKDGSFQLTEVGESPGQITSSLLAPFVLTKQMKDKSK